MGANAGARSGRGLGARLPMFASWAIIVALAAQETLNDWPTVSGQLPRAVAGIALAIAASVIYVVWQLRVVRGMVPESTRLHVLVLTGAAAGALVVNDLWAPVPLALSAIMLVLPVWRAALAVFVLLVGFGAFVAARWDDRFAVVVPLGIFALALVLYAFTRLSVVIRELQLTREELARTRVDQERERMQRDLHDMLGRTLVTASLRNQVALRTLDTDPVATREHLEQLHAVVTDGQARLRAVTSGPVIVSLADEIESATTLCQRLGIQITVDAGELPDGAPERDVGAIVRESITNMLKHSRALHCSVTIRAEVGSVVVTVVTVVNDGAGAGTQGPDGTGVAHMRSIAEGRGGSLGAEFLDGGRFRVSARLPGRDAPGDVSTPGDASTPGDVATSGAASTPGGLSASGGVRDLASHPDSSLAPHAEPSPIPAVRRKETS